jgi:N-acylneuraminate cytidylyltransferase
LRHKIAAIIPARADSKGVLGKNFRSINNQPLIWWSIKAALNARCIENVFVTTDSKEILKFAESKNIESIERPSLLASDNASMLDVIDHTIKQESFKKHAFSHICLLQPTSPLRTEKHIDRAFQKMMDFSTNAVISVTPKNSECLKWFLFDQDFISPAACNPQFPFYQRQNLPQVYAANGAIYLIETHAFIKYRSLITPTTVGFEMSAEESIDIDNIDDFTIAEKIMRQSDFGR